MSKIEDLELLSRPREKALLNGINTLSDAELLAIIIRCGVKGISSIELANNILFEYGGLSSLLKSDVYSLMKIKGIKQAKALEISAVVELMKRVSLQSEKNLMKIKKHRIKVIRIIKGKFLLVKNQKVDFGKEYLMQ